ncbi:lipase family protein [Rhodococcus sp. TAF43]|uniref:lipase family protein n=1 Tax=unclassified Rhodococcus (in: high G+C Gram-positive bacteria) TaxID=192944 RepID=UPI0015813B76|nr:lipase family protein [Rhodococcus sp. W8901]QKT10287.1 lipase [Rhodococcus sp. W8901]
MSGTAQHAPSAVAKAAVAFSVAAFTLTACGGANASEPESISLSAPAGPAGTTFWDVGEQPPADAKPGDVHSVQPRSDAPEGSQGWNIVYVSEIQPGVRKYVSGEIYVPLSKGDGPRDMVLWNHETTGLADNCAPSRRSLGEGDQSRVPAIGELLDQGYVVAMSDYPGQALPGPSYYMAGEVNARASLDVLRAVHNLPEIDASNRFVEYGWSQGGQTTMHVESILDSYAPEFDGVGAGLIAPAVRIRELTLNSMQSPELAGYVISTLPGIKAAYPDLRYGDFLTAPAMEQLPVLSDGCFDIWSSAASLRDAYQPGAMSPDGSWWKAFTAVDDFRPAGSMPFVIYQGSDDTTTPVALTSREQEGLCRTGTESDYREFPGLDHESVVPEAAKQFPAWAADRFAGKAAPSNCPQP